MTPDADYVPRRPSRSETVTLPTGRLHVRRWGDPRAPTMVLLHGYMDTSVTFQFMVDELRQDWNLVAPDWRGYGGSGWIHDTYRFVDHLLDLDALLDHYAGATPVRLVAHSMGANVASLYAGARNQRVRAFVSIEGIGLLPRSYRKGVAERFRSWLSALEQVDPPRPHSGIDELARRLARQYPTLPAQRVRFLAAESACGLPDGRIAFAADPYHGVRRAVSIPKSDFDALWANTTAPVLLVAGGRSSLWQEFEPGDDDTAQARLAHYRDLRRVTVPDGGHSLHLEFPAEVARAVEDFLLETR